MPSAPRTCPVEQRAPLKSPGCCDKDTGASRYKCNCAATLPENCKIIAPQETEGDSVGSRQMCDGFIIPQLASCHRSDMQGGRAMRQTRLTHTSTHFVTDPT